MWIFPLYFAIFKNWKIFSIFQLLAYWWFDGFFPYVFFSSIVGFFLKHYIFFKISSVQIFWFLAHIDFFFVFFSFFCTSRIFWTSLHVFFFEFLTIYINRVAFYFFILRFFVPTSCFILFFQFLSFFIDFHFVTLAHSRFFPFLTYCTSRKFRTFLFKDYCTNIFWYFFLNFRFAYHSRYFQF